MTDLIERIWDISSRSVPATEANAEPAATIRVRTEAQQDRAVARINVLVRAAHDVYHRVGRDHFTTELVAKEAGCAIGTVYRYFPDRVALMDVIAPNRPRV